MAMMGHKRLFNNDNEYQGLCHLERTDNYNFTVGQKLSSKTCCRGIRGNSKSDCPIIYLFIALCVAKYQLLLVIKAKNRTVWIFLTVQLNSARYQLSINLHSTDTLVEQELNVLMCNTYIHSWCPHLRDIKCW